MGTAAAIGVGSAALDFVNNRLTDDSNARNVRATNAANARLAKQQMQWQSDESYLQRQFEAKQADIAYRRELYKMAYNSPVEVLKRYRDAGINPQVAFAGENSKGVGNMTAPQASAVGSGVSASLPVMQAYQHSPMPNIVSGIIDSMAKMASIEKDLKDAGLSASQAHSIDVTVDANVRKLSAEAEGQELANFIAANYSEKRVQSELALNAQQMLTLASQGQLDEARKRVAVTEEFLNKELARYHGNMADSVKQKNETYMIELRAALENLASQSVRNYAEANKANAEADYSRDRLLNNAVEREKFVAETISQLESALAVHLDNEKRKKLLPLIEKQLELDIRQQGQDYWNVFRYVGTLLGGSAGAAIRAIAK